LGGSAIAISHLFLKLSANNVLALTGTIFLALSFAFKDYTQLKLPVVVTMDETPRSTHPLLKAYPMDARDENLYKTDLLKRAKKALAKYGVDYPVKWGMEK